MSDKKIQTSIFDYSEIVSINGNWKIIYRNESDTARIEKLTGGKKEFEILLHKDEIIELLSLTFNCK